LGFIKPAMACGLDRGVRIVRNGFLAPHRRFSSPGIFSLFFLSVILFCGAGAFAHAEMPQEPPDRIISLAPSPTEILFALGLGEKVVGVTRYCDYPESAKAITKVGGFFDPNYERIVALQPDLLILLTSHRDAKRELGKMGIRTLTVPHKRIGDIHEAIRLIGAACGAKTRAAGLVEDLTGRTQAVHRAVEGRHRPRVLICIGRDTESGQLAGMYMAGRNGFYDELIELAGAVNAYENETIAYPQLAAEGVIQLDPEVIIDLLSDIRPRGKSAEEIVRQWHQLRLVTAVRTGRVHAVVGSHTLNPGPRYVQFLEQLTRLLHPEAFVTEGHP